MSSYWGYHAMFDCAGCNQNIQSASKLKEFLKQLVIDIDMKAYGEPLMEHFATHDPEKAGYSFCQLIETSSITGHLVDKNGHAYIDIFSCKEYDVKVAENVIRKYFNPEKVRVNFVTRQAG